MPVREKPDADAMPAAGLRRQVGLGAVTWAVRRPDSRSTAEEKIGAPRIAARPAAAPLAEREDLFGGGQAWVGEGGGLGARRGGLFFWRRRGAQRSGPTGPTGAAYWCPVGRLFFGAAVGPGGNGGLLDLGDRNHPGGQEATQNSDARRDLAGAASPTSDAPRADAKYFGDVLLREAKRVERRAKFSRGHRQVARFCVQDHAACISLVKVPRRGISRAGD